MTVVPVITRELRASARQPFTFGLRMVGVAALLLTSLVFGLTHESGADAGGKLFGNLHCVLFCAIWILVPFLTADCLSRERREGTLGLLFLTRLKATDIVVAKSLAHGLRAVTLWLAVLPVVTIPFIMGGVGWHEAVLSALINFSAICCALAAGLLASAWSTLWLRAVLRAAIFSFFFLFVFWGLGTTWLVASLAPSGLGQWNLISDYALVSGLGFLANVSGRWSEYFRLGSVSQYFWAMGQLTILSLLLLVFSVMVAGSKTRRAWQEAPPSNRQLWFERTFCTPVLWLSLFHRWMRRKLERNPIGWLEQRTWSGRLVTWGWLAVIISLYSVVVTDRGFFRSYSAIQRLISWLLVGSLAMSAAGSFRRERETGVLELLLVSTLGERAIISGRLGGLWGQFLPSFGLLFGIWLYFSKFFPYFGDAQSFLFFGSTFLCLPVIGLYFSLRCRNFITAVLCTIASGLVAPPILNALASSLRFLWSDSPMVLFPQPPRLSTGAVVIQSVIAFICWNALHLRLKNRAFPLDRAI